MAIRIDAVGITVRDMAAALRFYRHFGLEFPEGSEQEDHVEATQNGYRLMWDSEKLIREMDPNWVEPAGQRVGIGFLCDSPDEVDATYAALLADGARGHLQPWDAFWGQRFAVVLDPDGNQVSLFAGL